MDENRIFYNLSSRFREAHQEENIMRAGRPLWRQDQPISIMHSHHKWDMLLPSSVFGFKRAALISLGSYKEAELVPGD